jgi:hypothetical protein
MAAVSVTRALHGSREFSAGWSTHIVGEMFPVIPLRDLLLVADPATSLEASAIVSA